MKVQPLPQVGFGPSTDGPFNWFPIDALPTKEKLKELFDSGNTVIETIEVWDPAPVFAELKARGLQMDEPRMREPREGTHRVVTSSVLTDRFARAISKIALNYFAASIGATGALLPCFDGIRRFIRYDEKPSWFRWTADKGSVPFAVTTDNNGHLVAFTSDRSSREIHGIVSLYRMAKYTVLLASPGPIVDILDAGHFFDSVTKVAAPVVRVHPR
jgi:hypothetical protein